jgi:hypothetical protein
MVARKLAVAVAATAAATGVHGFAAPGLASAPGLRARAGASALAMSQEDKCRQVRFMPCVCPTVGPVD